MDLALWQWIVLFALSAAALVRAGVTLAGAADEIATRTGMGGLLVGLLLAAAATSLPELVTVISAGAADAPDIAVGNVFGACLANMAILAIVDLLHRRRVLLASVELGHARLAAVAIALLAVAVVGISTPEGITLGWVGFDTVIILAGYLGATAWFRRSPYSARLVTPGPLPQPSRGREQVGIGSREVRPAVVRFGLATGAILVSGPLVALSGEGIADQAGISQALVGVILVALATTMPEFVVVLGAMRLGAHDLAVGSLLGSCAFNTVLLFCGDVAYTQGPLLSSVDPAQAVAGAGAIGLIAVAMMILIQGEETRIRRLEPDALFLLGAYVAALAAVAAAV